MFNKASTYRIQFKKSFNFSDLQSIADYLEKLGIGSVYASPVFKARKGSTDGYDIVNPHELNPEIGTYEEFVALASHFKNRSIGWLQDIAPNHMFYSPENPWINSILEKGKNSDYFGFFDINRDHHRKELNGKLLLPFLDKPLDEAINKGDIKIVFIDDTFYFSFLQQKYPLFLFSYADVLETLHNRMPEILVKLVNECTSMDIADDEVVDSIKSSLSDFYKNNEKAREYIDACIEKANSDKQILKKIIDEQIFIPAYYRVTEGKINYRRFFNINYFICLRMARANVFNHYHAFIKKLLKDGIISGLRIDHIDGMYSPADYLYRLREIAGKQTYMLVEKVLKGEEQLPYNWPVEGTTGYDFMAAVNNLFTNNHNEKKFTGFYQKFTGQQPSAYENIYNRKKFVLNNRMRGELDNIYELFINMVLPSFKDFPGAKKNYKTAIGELLACLPVYRIYAESWPLPDNEVYYFNKAISIAKKRSPELKKELGYIEYLYNQSEALEFEKQLVLMSFIRRCMQFSGPLMAKGVEDTALYVYNRFIPQNEIGDSPENFGLSVNAFHKKMFVRRQHFMYTMNKTASHNTKRGEDARARLNVLSDIPAKWFEMIEDWHRINLPEIEKLGAPEKNDEYFIYQTIAGILPMDGIVTDTVKNRLKEYITNAVKETRGHEFAWNEEKNAYKNNTLEFINTILEPEHPFYKSLYQFHHQIKDFGILNSLSQQIIKFTAPGIPAIYQGGELWDFSLVSPDNRGPVDFNYREDILNELLERFAENPLKSIQELWEERNIGKIKLWILHKLLHERKISSGAFEKGEYIPLQTSGAFKDKILAYIRRYHEHIYLVIIPLHLASIADKFNINNIDWADTKIHLPEAMPDEWDCLFTKQKYNLDRDIQVSELLKKIPFLCCKGITQQNEKGSGVLLHISSLPSSFGSGDLGPQAYQFADYLSQNGQKYWQILPLNPIEKGKGYSPYNSYSAFGGNTLLINPYLLIKYNLIRKEEIDGLRIKDKHYAQFDKTKKAKDWLFEIIYRRYCKFPPSSLKYEFNHFKEKESYWLHDHALFVALKHYFNKPWFDWPEKYKHRSRKVLEEFATKSHHAIEKEKFFQFLFYKQWHDLKDYCNAKNIRLFGDMPIYVSYDSVDVWVHPDYFKMNKNKEPLAVAGVPPDYFSKTGQLWGMPVFNWDHIKADNYEWWVNRIAKNLEFFDLLRIDHFRGLSAYWEVPAGEPTAENGYYVDVPGYELFDKIKERMGELPIVAEDLGEIDQPVYDLRDHYGFPGMRVLQFGFGEDQEHSPHYPGHDVPNAIVYTGTHDNNTLRGWYKKELNPEDKKRMQDFTGKKVRGGNVHNVLIHTAMQTNSRIVITPMQDILGKGEKAVMNKPGTTEDNWLWKMTGKDRKKARKSSFLLNETKESKRL